MLLCRLMLVSSVTLFCSERASTGQEPGALGGKAAAQSQWCIERELLAGVEDRTPVRSADENYYEYRAYHYLVAQAHKTPPAWLVDHSRGDLTFAHLFEQPARYRGELIHVEGKLRRLRRFDSTGLSAQQGVAATYEGWIYSDLYFDHPFCVVASEIDPALKIGEKVDASVSLDGYFFKRYRYKAADGWRDAPLLIGRRIVSRPTLQEPSESLFSQAVLPGVLILVAASAVLCVGLGWWLRRGDHSVRARIETLRDENFSETGFTLTGDGQHGTGFLR
jgi:hypothetical protein